MYNYIILRNLWKHMFLYLRVIIIFFRIKTQSAIYLYNKHVITPAQYITLISTQSRDHRLKQRFWNVSALKRAILWVPPCTTIVTPTTTTTITTSTFLMLNHRQEFVWAQKINLHNIIYIIYIIYIIQFVYCAFYLLIVSVNIMSRCSWVGDFHRQIVIHGSIKRQW